MYKINEIIKVEVTGITDYGIFVKTPNYYTGLIHISEIDNYYIKDINNYVKVGDKIFAYVLEVDKINMKLKLSIKNINYNNNNNGKRTIKENINGFLPLANKLDEWIKNTLEEYKKWLVTSY